MQVRTRSSFPHFPAHEPFPLLPIKRAHRWATRPLLGGELGLVTWTGPLSVWLHIVPHAQMEPDMETQKLFKMDGRKICHSSTAELLLQPVVLRPPEPRSDKGNKSCEKNAMSVTFYAWFWGYLGMSTILKSVIFYKCSVVCIYIVPANYFNKYFY